VNQAVGNGVDLDWAFANIPLLEGLEPGEISITPLPGYTNRNYRLHNAMHDWVLRLPRPLTDRFIDRSAEAHNQALAQQLGLAPGVIWRNAAGVTLTPTIRANRNLHATDFTNDESLRFTVEPLQLLHRSDLIFHGRENLGELLASHYALLDPRQQQHYATRMAQARRVLSLLEISEEEWVPSHRDLVLENLLLADERLWFIDWEYSAMASPYWDLATLCNEANLDLGQSRRLLQAYCAGGAAMKESTLFDYRGLLKLFSDCWMAALAQ
jgi:thiamine kinase-like enzyme